ncbi:MAG TPA: alpha/beta fold hydrolase [Actinomycetales bacterium]|nr:alpha/beta fold hydrolase [Actinomycetales bacterium]
MTTRLGHDVQGDPDAPVLVLSSSLGTTRDMWQPQLPSLTRLFRVVRFDHRGHGGSDAPAGPYRIEDLGHDVLALLDDLGVGRFSYAGVSLGGMVGLWLASTGERRVDRLAAICTSAHPDGRAAWRGRAAAVRAAGTGSVAADVVSRWFEPGWAGVHPGEVARFVAALSDEVDDEAYAACCDLLADLDLRPRLGDVSADTLVVAGSDDVALPADPHSQVIADGVPGSRLEVVQRAGHLATVDRADRCTRLLIDHLGGGT